MIFVTGDCHSDFLRFREDNFPEQYSMTKNDIVIICGDFGGVWYEPSTVAFSFKEYHLDELESKPFTTVFVDGNHENFNRLSQYPTRKWNGGQVHEIRPSVLHLMRGEVFIIEGHKFFTFGGASSHDIDDGLLDMDSPLIDKWYLEGKKFRIRNVSWWEQELPTQEEMDHGWETLEKHDYKVDYVITHSPCASTVALLGHGSYKQDILTKYLEEVRQKLEFKKWFFGHMHDNKQINDQEILIYEQIVRIV